MENPITPPPAFTTTSQQAPPKKEGVFSWLAGIGILLLKFKGLLIALKFGKIATTLLTMLASIWLYSLAWGWSFAAGFVLLILVHEMGHVAAAWWKKVPVSAPMFIPGLGALINLHEAPRDALTESHIGYGGPLFGALGATACWGLYALTNNSLFLAVASVTMMMNMFNMVPVSPLDGGRITAAISPRLWIFGLVGLFVWFLFSHSPIMLIVLVLGVLRLVTDWHSVKNNAYFQVPSDQRLIMAVLYFGLAAYLGWGHAVMHNQLEALGFHGGRF